MRQRGLRCLVRECSRANRSRDQTSRGIEGGLAFGLNRVVQESENWYYPPARRLTRIRTGEECPEREQHQSPE